MTGKPKKKRLGRPLSGTLVDGQIRGVGAVTESSILNVAITVFAEQGFDAVSMRQIAILADVTPANIYNYFSDKRSLYLEACRHCFGEIEKHILQAVDAAASPREKLILFVSTLSKALVDSPDAVRLFSRELVEVDRQGISLLENDSFEGPFRMLMSLLHEVTGTPPSAALAASVFALVFGLIQMSQFLEIGGGAEIGFHRDADKLAEYVMQMVAPSALIDVAKRPGIRGGSNS